MGHVNDPDAFESFAHDPGSYLYIVWLMVPGANVAVTSTLLHVQWQFGYGTDGG
jgi:hypothetical protein